MLRCFHWNAELLRSTCLASEIHVLDRLLYNISDGQIHSRISVQRHKETFVSCRLTSIDRTGRRLSMAIPDAEISSVRFFAVCCGWMIQPTAKVSEEMNRKRPARNTTVQLSTPYTDSLNAVADRQTDRRTDGRTNRRQYHANSTSYCWKWLKIISYHDLDLPVTSYQSSSTSLLSRYTDHRDGSGNDVVYSVVWLTGMMIWIFNVVVSVCLQLHEAASSPVRRKVPVPVSLPHVDISACHHQGLVTRQGCSEYAETARL